MAKVKYMLFLCAIATRINDGKVKQNRK